jgi:hypothetical protein
MPPDPLIRPAVPDDAPAIATIHAETWRVAYRGHLPDAYLDDLTPDSRLPMWQETLSGRHPQIQVWVVTIDDTVAGFASTNPARDEPGTGELATIYMHPDWMHGASAGSCWHTPSQAWSPRDSLSPASRSCATITLPGASTSARAGPPTAPNSTRMSSAFR